MMKNVGVIIQNLQGHVKGHWNRALPDHFQPGNGWVNAGSWLSRKNPLCYSANQPYLFGNARAGKFRSNFTTCYLFLVFLITLSKHHLTRTFHGANLVIWKQWRYVNQTLSNCLVCCMVIAFLRTQYFPASNTPWTLKDRLIRRTLFILWEKHAWYPLLVNNKF